MNPEIESAIFKANAQLEYDELLKGRSEAYRAGFADGILFISDKFNQLMDIWKLGKEK